jgi:hypothetical protein
MVSLSRPASRTNQYLALTALSRGGIPPSPRSIEMRQLRRNSRKIFDVKELTGKIFRTKDLASTGIVLKRHARRVSFAY